MTRDEVSRFATHWIQAWNAKDVEAVLGHFDEEARFTSPRAAETVGKATVEGKQALRAYWQARVAKIQSIRFTLDRLLWDDAERTMTIVYVAEIDGRKIRACEFLRLDASGRATWGEAMYGALL